MAKRKKKAESKATRESKKKATGKASRPKRAPARKRKIPTRAGSGVAGVAVSAAFGEASLGAGRRKFALCIGINNYGGANNLRGCIQDMDDWANFLQSKGFQGAGPNSTIQRLADAMGPAIRAVIDAVLNQAQSGDIVVIQYSGHGGSTAGTAGSRIEYICPADMRGISIRELGKLAANNNNVDVVFILDSCFSGDPSFILTAGLASPALTASSSFTNRRFDDRPLSQPAPGIISGSNRRLLISSCESFEPSNETILGGGNAIRGVFSHHALQALGNPAFPLTYRQWIEATRNLVATFIGPDPGKKQTARSFGADSMTAFE